MQSRIDVGGLGLGALSGLLGEARLPLVAAQLAEAPGQPLALLPWRVDGVPELG